MIIHSEQEMLNFGKNLSTELLSDSQKTPKSPIVIELVGDVGAGKTTFVRGFAKGLGIKKPITSPSFTISKSYALPNNHSYLIHYDFYRLSDPGLMSEDLKESFANADNIIIIEWSNSVSDIIPTSRIIIDIKKEDDNSRSITITDNRKASPFFLPSKQNQIKKPNPITTTTKQIHSNTLRLSLDTSTPETILHLNNKEYHKTLGNDLAEEILEFIHQALKENGKDWHDITEITYMSGPGSFTGLRIGAAVVNTLASELNIPLYDHHGNQLQLILPEYGRDANISKPKK